MTQIEITFLGTTAGVPTPSRNHASVHLRYQSEQEFSCLFDCGEGTQRQMFHAGINFMRINDIFISHWHADHFAGLLGLIETMNLEGRTKQLNIYGPEAKRFVSTLLQLGYSTKDFKINAVDVEFEGREITTILDSEEYQVRSAPMKHGIPAVAYGFFEKDRVNINKEKARKLGMPAKGPVYKILKDKGEVEFEGKKINLSDLSIGEKGKSVIYSGDTLPNDNMIEFAKDVDLLIHDSTFFMENEEKKYKHATFEALMNIAEKAKAKEVIATHISRRYQDTNELKEKIEKYKNVKLAKDFMKIVL